MHASENQGESYTTMQFIRESVDITVTLMEIIWKLMKIIRKSMDIHEEVNETRKNNRNQMEIRIWPSPLLLTSR